MDFGGGKHGKKENDAAGSGEKVSRERGPEFYREIGRKGGESRGNSKKLKLKVLLAKNGVESVNLFFSN